MVTRLERGSGSLAFLCYGSVINILSLPLCRVCKFVLIGLVGKGTAGITIPRAHRAIFLVSSTASSTETYPTTDDVIFITPVISRHR